MLSTLALGFSPVKDAVHPERAAEIEKINAAAVGWKAAPHARFATEAAATLVGVRGPVPPAAAILLVRFRGRTRAAGGRRP